jgi:hypothetical protein
VQAVGELGTRTLAGGDPAATIALSSQIGPHADAFRLAAWDAVAPTRGLLGRVTENVAAVLAAIGQMCVVYDADITV